MIYMLDTDISSYIIRKHSATILDKYLEIMEDYENSICISSITYAELMYGCFLKPAVRAVVEDFIREVDVFPWDKAAAYQYADIRLNLKAGGRVIGAHDMQIAAHARSLGHVLVTNNNKHFKDIPGIILENWS